MAEPQRNDTWLGTLLEKAHRRRVAKHMRAHPLVLQRRTGGRCRGDMLGQQILHAVRTQAAATCVREQGLIWKLVWLLHPGREDDPSVLAQRCTAFLTSLADHAHVCTDTRADQRSGLHQQGGDLPPAVSGHDPDLAHHRRRSQTSGGLFRVNICPSQLARSSSGQQGQTSAITGH